MIGGSSADQGRDPASRCALEAVIGRALLDAEFRQLLFADPDAALAAYGLSEHERAALVSLDAENLDACGERLGQRVLKALNRTTRSSASPFS